MSQTVITQAFEALKAQEAANGGVLTLDEFVFASVPNLNITDPIDRTEGLPPAAQIVHRQAVSKTGMVNSNAVVYSVVLGADVGDFEFNWVGLLNKASGVVAMIVHAPSQKKIKTVSGQQGNVLTRSFLMEYNGASQQTQIITPADTWQIDFTARLNGVDERIRQENRDVYGQASFMDEGFLVSGANGNYLVKKGVAYIEGLRAELLFDQAMAVAVRPSKIWVDVCWRGTLTSVWAPVTKLTVADTLTNYIEGDEQHYVFAIADILADGSVIDLRQSTPLAQMSSLNATPDTVLYFDKKANLKKSPLSDFVREMLAIPDAEGILSTLGLGGIEVTAESFGIVSGAVSAATAKANAIKIMQKASELSAAGGGKIIFAKSLYQVHMDEADYDPLSENIRVAALKIPYDNIILCGQGWFTTTIQAWATNSAYEVIQWTKSPLENGVTKVTGVGLHDICIDGNYHGDYTPGSYLRQCAAVRGAGIKGLSISRLRVINTSHYGMGLQNGGYIGAVIDGYWAENLGADGIDIKDNGGVSRACKLNNIIVRNFGQLDEPEHPWAGLDVMSFAPEISNVYISDFGDKGAIDAGLRLKNGTEGMAGTRGTGGIFANVSNITVVQNRFKASPSTINGVDFRASNVNYSNIVVRGTEGGRIGGGISLEERYCQGVNVQIAKAITGYSVTNGSNTLDRNYGDAEGCSVTNMSIVDATTAVVTTRKHQRLTSLTLKDCVYGLTSNGPNAGPLTVVGLYLENVTDPFGGLASNHNTISGIHGPGSANYQSGIGAFKDGAGNLAATTILSKSGVRAYVNSTESSAGTEVARFGSASSSILAPLIVNGAVTPANGNTYNLGSSSAPWAGGYIQAALTVTSDEECKSRTAMLARGSLEPVASSDPRLVENSFADVILDAWSEVDFVQFQYIDRIESKGDDGARWHVGVIAQRAQEAFTRHGLDPHRFAFFCYDEWPDAPEILDEETGEVLFEAVQAGSRYGIRYEEALVMEAALQRRNKEMILKRLDALEAEIKSGT